MNRLGVTPDLVCLSKGLTGGTLPLAVTLVREEIYESFLSEEKTQMFFHGHSFTGNPISCAAAVASLQLFKESDFMKRLAILEETHRQCLGSLRNEVPTLDVRICGTMAAIELDVESKEYSSQFSNRLMERALERGVFIRPLGNVIYMLPPYCSTPSELENAWATILAVLKERVWRIGQISRQAKLG